MTRLQQMFDGLARAQPEVLPSRYWVELNRKNLDQLQTSGYENFKRTIALNYFTWMVGPEDAQFRFLRGRLPAVTVALDAARALLGRRHDLFDRKQSWNYNFLTQLLWSYAQTQDKERILDRLDEPLEGNPPRVYRRGKLISQDLANSALEYQAIMDAGIERHNIRTVMELGAGYGRTAFTFLTLHPDIRYLVVDIPPALFVAERYLSSQFKDRRIFRYREFIDYSAVREEVERAEIAFFLPNQLPLLPTRMADLFINISSLHEMRQEQIEYYFEQIQRLTRRYFYFKQWKVSNIPYENIVIREEDYPIPAEWSAVYRRECAVQTYFFEALFRVGR